MLLITLMVSILHLPLIPHSVPHKTAVAFHTDSGLSHETRLANKMLAYKALAPLALIALTLLQLP